jgi:endonuclease/exonuclease/phosphatase family metal-dependent hydrolase
MTKLVTINAWGGKLLSPLIQYMIDQKADIYCLQEMMESVERWSDEEYCPDLLARLEESLPEYNVFYTPFMDDFFYFRPIKHKVTCGSAILVRKDIPLGRKEEHFVFLERRGPPFAKWGVDQPRAIQLLELPSLGLWVLNLHGLVTGSLFKGDSPPLLEQSKKVRSHMEGKRVILCGDFNITADCESMRILDNGMRNLIIEKGITNTRTHWWISTRNEPNPDTYSDYIIVPRDINVKAFHVDEVEISDHLPLVLEF